MNWALWLGSRATTFFGLIGTIGIVGTVSLLLRHYFLAKEKIIQVRAKEMAHPIFLRAGTSDFHTFCQIFALREYDFERFRSFPHAALVTDAYQRAIGGQRRPRIIDAGGNIGLSAVWFASQFPNADVVAVEPEEGNYRMLCENASQYPNIRTMKAAVWGRSGDVVRIETTGVDAWAYQCSPNSAAAGAGYEEVPTVSIGDLTPDTESLLIVKMDIEGAEEAVFSADVSWMKRTPLLVIELHDQITPFKRLATPFYRAIAKFDCEICTNRENTFVFMSPPDHRQAIAGNYPIALKEAVQAA